MDILESIFTTDNNIVEQLKEYPLKLDHKKLLFEHLGPELMKIYIKKKNKVNIKNYLEGLKYEYGLFGNKVDLPKAFSIYKKYADLNDYFCMYKMHVIYLCEYDKFKVQFSRVLERIYLFKCFAYLPTYMDDWDLKLFETIDIKMEIATDLDLEDVKLEKHQLFFDLLFNERLNFNLSENDCILMKGIFFCYFRDESEKPLYAFSELNSLIPKSELDYASYHAKIICFHLKKDMNLEDSITDSEIENFYKDIENKKLYQFYSDYGNYLINKINKATPDIIEIYTAASDNGHLFSSFRAYQCLIDYYDFDEIMEDYNKASTILDYMLEEIVFEKILFGPFLLFMGLLIKYSKFPEKVSENYLVYVKEISAYINYNLFIKEKKSTIITEEEQKFITFQAYIYYFGFNGIEEQNLFNAVEYLDKIIYVTNKIYDKKYFSFFRYNVKKLMYSRKMISNEELAKDKKELIELIYNNLNLKYQIIDCYIIGEDFLKGITRKKDEFNAMILYQYGQNIFCKNCLDCLVKSMIKKFLKYHENKMENQFKDDICSICLEKKPNVIFIPCKHTFCSTCGNKLEKEKKCPICRSQILVII